MSKKLARKPKIRKKTETVTMLREVHGRSAMPRLGVNIDHVATLRQLRGTPYPDLLGAAQLCEEAGAEQITVHLREDRRHIQPEDVLALRKHLKIPLNLEIAATPAMLRFALRVKPAWICLVPEKRNEVTTEGGLNLKRNVAFLKKVISNAKKAGIRVSLFVEPSREAMKQAAALGADAVELHTGRYCMAAQGAFGKGSEARQKAELDRIRIAGELALGLGLQVHAGHGFDYQNVRPVCELNGRDGKPLVEEYNIGHAIVCQAAMVGMGRAVREMLSALRAP